MPTPVTRPSNYPLPFAASGAKNTIPTPSTGTGKASFTDGFPPVTMLPLTAGGIPPEGKDFNGILYDITLHTVWVNTGGQYQFDAALSTAIGGYPSGMVLQNNAGTASYVSAVANNTTDFNTTPSSIGTLWLPYSGRSFANVSIATTGGTTVLTAIQAAARFITITGTLTSNATITLPSALGNWTVINNTTGAFSVTVIALGGAGVPILQGGADGIFCDGTNVRYEGSSALTRTPGDSTKAIATTEFATSAIATAIATALLKAGGTMSGALNYAHGSDVASASTINLTTATGNVIDVTGTTTINTITLQDGATRIVRFTGILQLTNSANLILPGGANIVTSAGDFAVFVGYASGVVRCASYQRISGAPVTTPLSKFFESAKQTITSAGLLTLAHGLGVEPKLISATLKCLTAEGGYSVGDSLAINIAPPSNTNAYQSIKSDATNLYIRFGSAASVYGTLNGSTGSGLVLTNGNWALILRAWA